MGERKEREPLFRRLDEIGETSEPLLGLRGREPEQDPGASEPEIPSVSALTTRALPAEPDRAVPGTPGEAMRTAREGLDLDVVTLALRTRLSRKTIEDLEANRFDAIPPAYVRGYLRAVARELNADGDGWVRAYEGLGFTEPVLRPTTMQAASPDRPRRAISGKWYGLLVVVVVAALGLGIYAWNWEGRDNPFRGIGDRIAGLQWPQARSVPEPVSDTPPVPPESQVAEPMAPAPSAAANGLGAELEIEPMRWPDPPIQPPASEPAPPEDPLTAADEAQDAATEFSPGRTEASAGLVEGGVSAAPDDAAGVLPPGHSSLQVSFQATSWVEIRSASDRVELRGIFHPGDERSLAVELPVRVVLGNAPGVTLARDGSTIDMAPYTQADRTARFTLGAD